MKIIYFGYNLKNNLDSGIDGLYKYQGKYLDIVNINNKNYLITQGVSEYKKDVIFALEIIQDVYLDGSFITYGNGYKSKDCMALEYYFNSDDVKRKIEQGASPLSQLLELGLKFKRPNIIPLNDNKFVMVVIIKNNIFENVRDLFVKNRNKSFIEISQQRKKFKVKRINRRR